MLIPAGLVKDQSRSRTTGGFRAYLPSPLPAFGQLRKAAPSFATGGAPLRGDWALCGRAQVSQLLVLENTSCGTSAFWRLGDPCPMTQRKIHGLLSCRELVQCLGAEILGSMPVVLQQEHTYRLSVWLGSSVPALLGLASVCPSWCWKKTIYGCFLRSCACGNGQMYRGFLELLRCIETTKV